MRTTIAAVASALYEIAVASALCEMRRQAEREVWKPPCCLPCRTCGGRISAAVLHAAACANKKSEYSTVAVDELRGRRTSESERKKAQKGPREAPAILPHSLSLQPQQRDRSQREPSVAVRHHFLAPAAQNGSWVLMQRFLNARNQL